MASIEKQTITSEKVSDDAILSLNVKTEYYSNRAKMCASFILAFTFTMFGMMVLYGVFFGG